MCDRLSAVHYVVRLAPSSFFPRSLSRVNRIVCITSLFCQQVLLPSLPPVLAARLDRRCGEKSLLRGRDSYVRVAYYDNERCLHLRGQRDHDNPATCIFCLQIHSVIKSPQRKHDFSRQNDSFPSFLVSPIIDCPSFLFPLSTSLSHLTNKPAFLPVVLLPSFLVDGPDHGRTKGERGAFL